MLHLREVRQTVQRPAFLGCAGVYRSVLYAQALGIRLAICIVFLFLSGGSGVQDEKSN